MSEAHKDAATLLIETINATGGLMSFPDGRYGPRGDDEWFDLADAYLVACAEKGIEQEITPFGDDPLDDDHGDGNDDSNDVETTV